VVFWILVKDGQQEERLVGKEPKAAQEMEKGSGFKYHEKFANTQLVAQQLAKQFTEDIAERTGSRRIIRLEYLEPQLIVLDDDRDTYRGKRMMLIETLLRNDDEEDGGYKK
jgi:hypothetical protein